jgi:hypothetical protein
MADASKSPIMAPAFPGIVGGLGGAIVGLRDSVSEQYLDSSATVVNEVSERLTRIEKESAANQVLQECVESLVKENETLQARYDLLLGKYMELVDRVAGLLPPVKAHGKHESAKSTCPKPELL